MRADPFGEAQRIPDVAAQQFFTNREDAITTFRSALAVPAGQSMRALVFYGVGGVGKTSLLHRLREALPDKFPRALVDLQSISDKTRAYREVLLKLRSDLGTNFGVEFPRFDLCLAVLLAREGDDPPPIIQLNPRLAGTFKLLFELLQLVPGVGIGAVVVGTATRWAAGFPGFQDFLRKAGGMEEVFELRRRAARDDQSLPTELVRRFAEDLREQLPLVPGRACRCVLFFDTYEHLWAGRDTGPEQAKQLDWWVRDLVKFCTYSTVGVLPVIAGRDRLWWAENSEWAEMVEQHLLGGLSAGDAQTFLARCGIGRPMGEPASSLQEAIVRCCDTSRGPEAGCHPLFLALCAEIALNTRRATGTDPPPATFAVIPTPHLAHELATRFLTSLHSRAMELWVIDLSLTARFDDDAALALDEARRHRNGSAGWEQLRRFSFIEPQADGFYRLHKTMRAALRTRIEPDAARAVHDWFSTYWSARAQPSLSWFHRWTVDPKETLIEWKAQHKAALKQLRIGEARALLSRWAEISLDDADRQAVGDELWALTHFHLGSALSSTPFAPRRDPLNAAIGHFQLCLLVYTQTNFPRLWAGTQNDLGNAHVQLPSGDRGENLRRAIACHEAALRVYTEADFPEQWAGTQGNLGVAYADLPTGDRGENLRRAIACYEAALRVYTEADTPQDWATTQNNLGLVHWNLPAGDRGENLRRAIACYEAALRVHTEAGFPKEWSTTQANLGVAYTDLPMGDRGENLRRAIACYEAALRVYTEADFPEQWADVRNNLGVAYSYLPTGDRGENLRRTIACFEAVLRVYTEADFPWDWAATQNNLGEAYRDLPTGDRVGHLRKAIAYHEAALRVCAEATQPAQWAVTHQDLATALLALGEMTADNNAICRAREHCVAASRGFGSVGLTREAAGVDGILAKIDAALAGMTALPPKTDSPTDATRPSEE
jgi:tetratricopeptide (TPR) repeat protein